MYYFIELFKQILYFFVVCNLEGCYLIGIELNLSIVGLLYRDKCHSLQRLFVTTLRVISIGILMVQFHTGLLEAFRSDAD